MESFGKLIGKQGYAEMGYRTPEIGVGVATWAIRREWSMTHWRESANLMWRNLEHMTGAYSEHAETKRCTQRRVAWGDAHRAVGTHRANGTSRKRNHRALEQLQLQQSQKNGRQTTQLPGTSSARLLPCAYVYVCLRCPVCKLNFEGQGSSG